MEKKSGNFHFHPSNCQAPPQNCLPVTPNWGYNSVAHNNPRLPTNDIDSSTACSESESELLYDWRFTVNQFVLAPSLLRLTTRVLFFLQHNPYGDSPWVTISLTRRRACLLWVCLAFVKCTYRTYSMSLKILPFTIYTSPLSVQALQCRSCLSYATTEA
jgi:hypothetical protein